MIKSIFLKHSYRYPVFGEQRIVIVERVDMRNVYFRETYALGKMWYSGLYATRKDFKTYACKLDEQKNDNLI